MSLQKPPLGAGVDWSHPLANGLEALWLMNEATGDRVHDVTRHGHNGTRNGMVDDDWVANIQGTALAFDADTKFVEVTDATRLGDMAELTLFALTIRRGSNGADVARLIHKANGATSDDYHLGQSLSGVAQFRIRTAGAVTINTGASSVLNEPYAQVGTWEGAGGAMDLFQKNLIDSAVNTASGTNAGTLNDAAQNLAFGRHKDSSTRNFNGEIIMAGISRRKWTRDDIEWFVVEPYAMMAELEPQRTFFIITDNTAKNKRRSAFTPLPFLVLPPIPDGVID